MTSEICHPEAKPKDLFSGNPMKQVLRYAQDDISVVC